MGDPAANVRTVLSLSYRHLPEKAARMFRLLGLHPGPDISAAAAASLAGMPVAAARVALRDLTRASLLMEVATGRYAFHDLLRAYAAEQATPAGEVTGTTRRMLDHYLHAAHQAHRVLYPGRELIDLDALAPGVTPETFGGKASALAWLEAEYQVLLKVTDAAARTGFDVHAWRLPVVLWTFHNVCGHWHDGTRLHHLALDAARRCGDVSGQAHVLRGLGSFAMSISDFGEAYQCLTAAQAAFTKLGDTLGLARTDVIFSQTLEFQGRHAEALAVIGEALRLSECAPSDRHMMLVRASALNGSAWNSVQLGDLSAGAGLLHAGHRAVPGDRLLPRRGRHLGHARRRAAAARRARRGAALLPACRHARPGDGQPLRPRDGARAPRRDLRGHRGPARCPPGLGRGADDPGRPASSGGVRGPGEARIPQPGRALKSFRY